MAHELRADAYREAHGLAPSTSLAGPATRAALSAASALRADESRAHIAIAVTAPTHPRARMAPETHARRFGRTSTEPPPS